LREPQPSPEGEGSPLDKYQAMLAKQDPFLFLRVLRASAAQCELFYAQDAEIARLREQLQNRG